MSVVGNMTRKLDRVVKILKEKDDPLEQVFTDLRDAYIEQSKSLLEDSRYSALSSLYQDIVHTTLRLMIWYEDDNQERYNATMRKYQTQLQVMCRQLEIPKEFAVKAQSPKQVQGKMDANNPFGEN